MFTLRHHAMSCHAMPYTDSLSLLMLSSLQRDRVGAMWNPSYITLLYRSLGSAVIRCRLSTASSYWLILVYGGRRRCLDSSLSATQQEGERYPNRAVAGVGYRRLACLCGSWVRLPLVQIYHLSSISVCKLQYIACAVKAC